MMFLFSEHTLSHLWSPEDTLRASPGFPVGWMYTSGYTRYIPAASPGISKVDGYMDFFFFFFFFAHFHFPASGQAVVTGVIPSPPRFLPSIFYRA